ncbi:MAG: hypothetical protein BWY15_00251 [Firmicutes bacterium ADurb.Bin193]|nr:MAG: hypothetical protein BWY15_00251 [Firmicutes bacterium ADurb.Bin193]
MNYNKSVSDKSGFAYLYVLIAIMLTGILGVGLLTFTLMNTRISASVLKRNLMFYETEASIAAAHMEIEKVVRKGQETARDYTESVRDDIRAFATSFDPETGLEIFDEEAFRREYERVYCDSFNRYICSDEEEENGRKAIIGLKNTISGIVDIQIPSYDLDLILDPKTKLYVTVEAEKTEGVEKKRIIAKFRLLREASVSIKTIVLKRRNPVWMRAVTAEGDVIAVGGKVTIWSSENSAPIYKKADAVYAWGTNNFRSEGTNATGHSYGGIIAGVNQRVIDSLNLSRFGLTTQSGSIEIRGETVTDSYIHTFGDNSSIEIDVENSELSEHVDSIGTNPMVPYVFAESIQTEEFSNGNSITILGSTLIKDDLEVNGSGGNISVSGSLIGFSSGPDTIYENDKFANRSSSIAYNDLFASSTINIGKYVVVSGVAYNSNVIYTVDPYRDTPYKTGESLGIGENHKIYRYYFEGEDIAANFDNNFKLSLDGELYDYPVFSGKMGSHPNSTGDARVRRFKDYLINYHEIEGVFDYNPHLGNDIINIGTNNGGLVYGYSLGVLPANGKLYYPLTLSEEDKQTTAYSSGLMCDFDHIYGSDTLNFLKQVWKDRYNTESWIVATDTQRKPSPEFSTLVDFSIDMNADLSSVDDIVLKSSGGDLNVNMSDIDGKGGLLFARGNIIISGDTDGEFRGAVSAGGSVIFKGAGDKKFIYNESNVIKAIKLDLDVMRAFTKGGISEADPDSIEIELKSQKNVVVEDYREIG